MLYRRIYFLFHDETTTRNAITGLESDLGLEDYQLHALARSDEGLIEMPGGTVHKKSPQAERLEKVLWYFSITVFTLALIFFVLALLATSLAWAVVFAIIVVGAQLSGYLFTDRAGSAQLDRFRTALDHGEILLMVDVPRRKVREVKAYVDSRHPEAKTNGGNWHIGALGT